MLKKPAAVASKLRVVPSMSVERSRKQVMLRNGDKGPGSTFKLEFKAHGGEAMAVKKAKAWLVSERKKYTGTFDKVM